MKRLLAPVLLAVAHLFALGAAATFYLRTRPELVEHARAAGSALGLPARLALSAWLLPAVMAASLLPPAAALFVRRRRTRLELAAAGLVLCGLGFTFFVLAALLPIFR
jgi:hypothetical protein